MIDLRGNFTNYFNRINTAHETIDQLDKQSLSQEDAENWEIELEKIDQEFRNFLQTNILEIRPLFSQENEEAELLVNNLKHSFSALTHDREAMQLILLFKGRGVNHPIQSYMEKYPLKDRVLILGCGHRPDHHAHEGAYCIDNNPGMLPDAKIDIRTSLMDYLPTASFPKIILENLPTDIFNDMQWQGIFNQLHRVLAVAGDKIKFNSMFGMDTRSDFDNMFNLLISDDELQTFTGKRMTECPDLCSQYNEKLKNCFASVNFEFSQDFDMSKMPGRYTIYKMDAR